MFFPNNGTFSLKDQSHQAPLDFYTVPCNRVLEQIMPSNRSHTYLEARHLRKLLYELAVEIHSSTSPSESLIDRANTLDRVVRAWESAADRERIASGKPLPGSIRPEKKIRRRRQVFGPIVEAAVPGPDNKPV